MEQATKMKDLGILLSTSKDEIFVSQCQECTDCADCDCVDCAS